MIWVAPFLGEFGWETTIWSPWLRYEQARLQVPFTVMCERGKTLLYEDFAEVAEVDIFSGPLRRDCQNAFRPEGGKLTKHDYENYCFETAGHGVKCLTPIDLKTDWPGGTPQAKLSKFKSYREDWDKSGSVVLHARDHQHADRNWSREKWNDLVARLRVQGFATISVGSEAGALRIEGTEDMRGVPLDRLAHVLSFADFIVGPSSGPMAFAMLCETPVVWWSKNRKDKARFARLWNPFNVLHNRVKESWQPTVEEVVHVCRRFW